MPTIAHNSIIKYPMPNDIAINYKKLLKISKRLHEIYNEFKFP